MTVQLSALDLAMWRACARAFQPKPQSKYLTDPVGWVENRLGEFLWSKQQDIARSVVAHRKTAVRSCHNVGKSRIASRLAAWFVDVHPPGEAFVVSTAPTYAQVHAILWEEIRNAAKKAAAQGTPLPGRVLGSDQWKLDDGTLVGWGRKPADTDQHGFQGIHRRHVLVIVDEACGIPRQLWTAVEAITTGSNVSILALGNPDDPNTEFGDICKPGSGWNTIAISAFDTPNLTGEDIPDDLRPLMLDPDWVEDKRRRWGVDSPRYSSKVLGEFPDIGIDTLFPPSLIEAAQQRTLDPSGRRVLGVDVARYGADRSVIYLRRGPVIRLHSEHSKLPTTETTGRVIAAKRETQADEIRVDGVGIGAGVVDQLTEQGYPVLDMQAGARATEPDRFVNQRAEWAWNLRDLLESGDADLDPADDELAAQLGALKFRYDSRGRIAVESKDEARKRGLPSPDHADAAILTAVAPVGSDMFRALNWRYFQRPVTAIPGQVDCAGEVSTLTEGWVYGSVHLPSGEDAATDWAVAAMWCQTIHGDLLLLDLRRQRLGDSNAADLLAPLVRTHRPDTVFVSRRQLTDAVCAQASRSRIPVTPLDVADADLFARALVASSVVVAGRVWLPAGATWASQWVAETGAYPHTRAHGCVAALALATHVQTTKWQPPPRTPAAASRTYDDGPNFMTIPL